MGLTQSKGMKLKKSRDTSLPPESSLEPQRDPMTAFLQMYSSYGNNSFTGLHSISGSIRNRSRSTMDSTTDSSGSRRSRSRSLDSDNSFKHTVFTLLRPLSPPYILGTGSVAEISSDITSRAHQRDALAALRSRMHANVTTRSDLLYHFGDALQALLNQVLFGSEDLPLPAFPNTEPIEHQADLGQLPERDKIVVEILDLMLLVAQDYGHNDDINRMRAESFLQRIKLERTRMFGADDAMVLTATGWLATIYYERGEWGDAEAAAAEFVAKDKGRPDKWDSKILLFFAKLYLRQEKWVEAEPILEELEGRIDRKEENSIGRDVCLESLADAYMAQEKWSKVKELMVKNEQIKFARKMDFAMALVREENWTDAKRAIRRRDLPIRLSSSPIVHLGWRRENSPRYMLALIYLERQRWERAESKFSGGVRWDRWQRAIRKSNWRHDDWENLRGARGLCEAYIGMKKDGEAERLLLQVIEGSKSGLGDKDVDTLDAMDVLASFYISKERWDEAEPLISHSIASRKEMNRQGPSHPATLRSMEMLAKLYMGMARWEEAATLLEEVVAKRDTLTQLGPDHPHTFRSIDLLSQVYRKLERWREMDGLRRRMLRARMRN